VNSLIVNAWVKARPCMRRTAPLAAFAESGTCSDRREGGGGGGGTSSRLSLWVLAHTNSGPALSGNTSQDGALGGQR
jgi:hypothetical protein